VSHPVSAARLGAASRAGDVPYWRGSSARELATRAGAGAVRDAAGVLGSGGVGAIGCLSFDVQVWGEGCGRGPELGAWRKQDGGAAFE
jgi:hypothetical protein